MKDPPKEPASIANDQDVDAALGNNTCSVNAGTAFLDNGMETQNAPDVDRQSLNKCTIIPVKTTLPMTHNTRAHIDPVVPPYNQTIDKSKLTKPILTGKINTFKFSEVKDIFDKIKNYSQLYSTKNAFIW